MAQLAFKQAKFYFQFQNDRAKGRMGPSWAVMSLYRSHTSSLQSLEEKLTFFTSVVYNMKSQETQNKIFLSPAIEESKYEFWFLRHIIQLGPILPFAWSF